jgi:hypothetical protein
VFFARDSLLAPPRWLLPCGVAVVVQGLEAPELLRQNRVDRANTAGFDLGEPSWALARC